MKTYAGTKVVTTNWEVEAESHDQAEEKIRAEDGKQVGRKQTQVTCGERAQTMTEVLASRPQRAESIARAAEAAKKAEVEAPAANAEEGAPSPS